MALGGYVVKLDLPGLMELVSLLRRSINNLDQLTPPGGMRPGGSTILIWRMDNVQFRSTRIINIAIFQLAAKIKEIAYKEINLRQF